jgi:diguanylate cyclase (GGDEF)-like protein
MFRQLRKRLTQQSVAWPNPSEESLGSYDPSTLDPVTGLCTRSFAEQWLAKQVTHARRSGEPLTLLILRLEDFGQVNEQYGKSSADHALRELARRLKKASRGCDLAVRMGADEFLVALPGCGVGGAKRVLDRLGPIEINCDGTNLTLAYSAAWIDHQPGESPTELLGRADQMLQLYKNAGRESAVAPVADLKTQL